MSAHAALILSAACFTSATPAQAKQCSAERPSNAKTYWSYRLIDGRKCWYEGKPMLSKASLHWPAASRTASVSARTEPNVTPSNKFNLLDAQASMPADVATGAKVELVEMVDASPAPERSLTPDHLRAWGEGVAATAAKPIVTIIDRWPDRELPQQGNKPTPAEEPSRVNGRALMTTAIAFLAILAVLVTMFKTLGVARRRVGLQLLDR